MTGESAADETERVTVCSACGADITEDNVETVEDGAYQRMSCPDCGEVDFRETFRGKQQRYEEGDESALGYSESMQERIEQQSPPGTLDDGPTVTPDVDMGDISIECQWEGCGKSPNDLEEGEQLHRTVEDGLLCPEHFKEAVEEHGHEQKYTPN